MTETGQIICGDAAKVLHTLKSESVALTVTSPPYFKHRDYGVRGQIGQEETLEKYLVRIGKVLAELFRVTDARGSCFVVIGDTYLKGSLCLVPHRIAMNAASIGWSIRNDIIWEKTDPPPESVRTRWRSGHEHILFLSKRSTGYRFNSDSIRIPHSAVTLRRWGNGQTYGGTKSETRTTARDTRIAHGRSFRLNPSGCIPTDVWELPCKGTVSPHYAAYAAELVKPIISACSSPGDLVIDPFAGTGTTCVEATKIGCRTIGIELNPEYACIAREQLEFALTVRNGSKNGRANKSTIP